MDNYYFISGVVIVALALWAGHKTTESKARLEEIKILEDTLKKSEERADFYKRLAEDTRRDNSAESKEISRLRNLLVVMRATLHKMKGRNRATITCTRSWLP